MRVFLLLLGIVSFGMLAHANQKTILKGKAPDYAKQILTVYGYSDYISNTLITLAVDTVEADGTFKFEVLTNQIIKIQIPLGYYNGTMFIDTAQVYELVLPNYKPLTKAEQLNPFYEPQELFIGIKNIQADDINLYIQEFEYKYNEVVGLNYASLFKSPNKHLTDSVINTIEAPFDSIPNRFFKDYREYKYAWINYISVMRESRYVIREYFQNKPILYQNPAYMDLFNQIFENYFTFYGKTKEGERLYSDLVFAKSPKYIKQTLANNLVVTGDEFQNFVILKGLHDAFSANDFPIQSLLITLDSVAYLSKVNQQKVAADQIRKKVLQARAGFKAPSFEIRDANGVFRTNSEYLANYVYLNFFSLDSYACQSDLELLKALFEKHKADFKVISINVDEDFGAAIKYFKEKGYEWTLLSYKEQPSIISEYKLKVYPTYYLIDPNGKLAMSPAVGPSENFEWRFFKYLQSTKQGAKE